MLPKKKLNQTRLIEKRIEVAHPRNLETLIGQIFTSEKACPHKD